MEKRQVQNQIYEGLARILHQTRFRLSRKAEGFVRRIPGGRQEIGVALRDFTPHFQYSLVLCIRLDQVEEIFHLFSGALPAYHNLSFTTTTLLSAVGGPEEFYNVSTPEQVAGTLDHLSPLLQSHIVPLLDNLQTLAALDRKVNNELGFDTTLHPWKGMHGVILAQLASNPNWEGIVTRYRQEMNSQSQPNQAPYEQVVEYLRSRKME